MLEMRPSQARSILFLAIVVLCARVVAAELHKDIACNGHADAGDCLQHRLQCNNSAKLFPLRARHGFKPLNSGCSFVIANCSIEHECCAFQDSDCFKDYSDKSFLDIIEKKKCWNQADCSFRHQRPADATKCDENFNPSSVSSVIEFACIEDDLIQNFTNTTGASGSEAALTYVGGSTGKDVIFTCQVNAVGRSEGSSADVVLYKSTRERYTNDDCTRLSLKKANSFSCREAAPQFEMHNVSLPFTLSLHVVKESDAAEAWAVIHGKGTALTVTCHEGQKETSISSGSSTTSAVTVTSQGGQEGTRTPGKEPSSTTDPTSPPSSAPHTGLIMGVAVAVIVIIIVIIVLGVHCWRRSSRKRGLAVADGEPPADAQEVVPLRGSSDDSQGRYSTMPVPDGAEDRSSEAAGKSTPSIPASSSTTSAAATTAASTAAATAADSSETDYDHLGKMRPATSPHDVTYGHLQVGNDVTGGDYDHVGRLGQVPGAQRVIDNIYYTAGPAGAASDFDDNVDYNVTGSVSTQRGEGVSSHYDAVTPLK